MQHKISPDDVKIGMFVCGFGGGWFDHPFWFKRFLVQSKHLKRLAEADIPYVVVDDQLGIAPESAVSKPGVASDLRPPNGENSATVVVGERRTPSYRALSSRVGFRSAQPSKKDQAKRLVRRSLSVMRSTFDKVRSGDTISIEEVGSVVTDIVSTTARCPQTMLEVIRLKNKDEYTYLHSVAVCTLMVNVARQLGKSQSEVFDLGLAGLFHDLGKMRIDETILNKAGKLNDGEFEKVRGHPVHGYDILSQTAEVPEIALDVCRHHHERPDGKGYPDGISGDGLSEAARLGAICDVYDALTSDRAYKDAWTPTEAVAAMWGWEGQFDRDLFFKFMQSIGSYPPGLIVELQNGKLAIVLEPKGPKSRSRALCFFSMRNGEFIEPREISIWRTGADCPVSGPANLDTWGLSDSDCTVDSILQGRWRGNAGSAAA